VVEVDELLWWWVATMCRQIVRNIFKTKWWENTYAWGWYWWWLKESNSNVLCISLNTTNSSTTDDLWVSVNEETLSIGSILLNLCCWWFVWACVDTSSWNESSISTTWEWSRWSFISACTSTTASSERSSIITTSETAAWWWSLIWWRFVAWTSSSTEILSLKSKYRWLVINFSLKLKRTYRGSYGIRWGLLDRRCWHQLGWKLIQHYHQQHRHCLMSMTRIRMNSWPLHLFTKVRLKWCKTTDRCRFI